MERLVHEICRLCLKNNQLLPLYKGMSVSGTKSVVSKLDISTLVSRFTNLRISKDDGFPQQVCRACLLCLKSALEFRRMCGESDRVLRRSIVRLKNKETSEAKLFSDHFPEFIGEVDPECRKIDSLWEDDFDTASIIKSDLGVSSDNENANFQDPAILEVSIFQQHFPDSFLFEKKKRKLKKAADTKWPPAPSGYDRRGRPRTKRRDQAMTLSARMTKKEKRHARKLMVEAFKTKRESVKPDRKRKAAKYLDALQGEYTSEGPVFCKICGRKLSNVQSLRLHAQVHFGFNFICELCGKGCRSYASLDQHFMTKHGRERRLACVQCDYRAINRGELRVHERTHTGERPYVCDQCGASFHRRFCLIAHVKRHSSKQYKCDRCPKAYVQNSGLKAHVNNVHDRQFAFKCHLCEQTYSRTITVRKHLEEKHNVPRDKQGQIKKINLHM